MASDITFRQGIPADAFAFAELDELCFPVGVSFSTSIFRYHLHDPRSVNIVAEDFVGIAGFSVGKAYRSGKAGIVTVDVHPDWRSRSIGYKLLSRLEEGLVELGAKSFFLQVAVDNEIAIALYEKVDYRRVSLLPGYYPDPDFSRGTDAYLMEK